MSLKPGDCVVSLKSRLSWKHPWIKRRENQSFQDIAGEINANTLGIIIYVGEYTATDGRISNEALVLWPGPILGWSWFSQLGPLE